MTDRITVACLDMAGTTVADDGTVLAAFASAMREQDLTPDAYAHAMTQVRATMGQAKIAVFRALLDTEDAAHRANAAFERYYAAAVNVGQVAPLPGAIETFRQLRSAGVRVCLGTGFSPATRDTIIGALGWQDEIDLALSPADTAIAGGPGRGRPAPDLPLTALLRLGGGSVRELAVAGDTPSDVESGLRAGAGLVAGVLTGTGTRGEFEQAGAPLILNTISEIVPYITGVK